MAEIEQQHDLSKTILAFWHERLLIAAILLCAALCGIAYITLLPQKTTVTWEISPLQFPEFDKYQALNSLLSSSVNPLALQHQSYRHHSLVLVTRNWLKC